MNNELYHHGVKGMRWGIRNAETKARYKREIRNGGGSQKNRSKFRRVVNVATTPTIKQGKGKDNISPAEKMARDTRTIADEARNISNTLGKGRSNPTSSEKARSMTDSELRQAINRIKMEREYDSLTRDDTRSGFEKVSDVLSVVGSSAAIAASAASTAVIIKALRKG